MIDEHASREVRGENSFKAPAINNAHAPDIISAAVLASEMPM